MAQQAPSGAERAASQRYMAAHERGDSGDTSPYAIERELEDLEVLIAADRRGDAVELFGDVVRIPNLSLRLSRARHGSATS